MFVVSYAANGEKAIVYTLANLAKTAGAGESAVEGSLYQDTRTQEGWQISPLNPPLSQFVGQLSIASEADSGNSLWEQHTPAQSAFNRGLYIRSATGTFRFVGALNPPLDSSTEEESNVIEAGGGLFDRPVAATYNYEHVVIFAPDSRAYWPFDATTGNGGSLYEYSGSGNQQPILVGVSGAKGSTNLIATCGTRLGGEGSDYNSISTDGETIFLTVEPCSVPATDEIYARKHGSLMARDTAETVDISASGCTVACGGESGKNFEGASEDGSKVFFTSTQKLTNDAQDGTGSGSATSGEGCAETTAGAGGCNLYSYDFTRPVQQRLKLIAGGEVVGVSAVAENGSRVYFVSRTPIAAAGGNSFGYRPQDGQPNLYVYDVATSDTTFIATLSEADGGDWSKEFRRSVELAGQAGRYIIFTSAMPGLTPDASSTQIQLYEYNAETTELVRVTKGEDGYNEDGNAVTSGIEPASLKTIAERLGNGRDFKSLTNRLNISQDGKTIIFATRGQLSARASSAVQHCRSLYEFHSAGSIAQGNVSLISDGRDTQLNKGVLCGPQFQAIDANGENVMFTTADPLVAADTDGLQRDVYDARVGGGFPWSPSTEVALCAPPDCEGSPNDALMPTALSTVSSPGEAGTSATVPIVSTKKTIGKRKTARRTCRSKARKPCKRRRDGRLVPSFKKAL